MNEIKSFDEANKELMVNYVALKGTIDEYTKMKKNVENELFEQMIKYGVKSLDNTILKATVIAESESKSIDLKKFKEIEPIDYAQLLVDYPKITHRKSSLRITVKK